MPVALKAVIIVSAGVVPNEAMLEHGRRWDYTSVDYEADRSVPVNEPTRFSKMLDEAHRYAMSCSNPAYLNWVNVEWLWI